MADARAAFLDAAATAQHLLERRELAERWPRERDPAQALRVL